MYIERKEDLSIFYWLQDLFSDAPFITIRDGFPMDNLTVPTVSIDAKRVNPIPWEIGNKNNYEIRLWAIEIFAVNKSQRDEIAYRLLHALEENIPVYDYDEGFPPDVSPTQLGCLFPENINLEIIKIFPELTEKLYYRATITFVANYSEL